MNRRNWLKSTLAGICGLSVIKRLPPATDAASKIVFNYTAPSGAETAVFNGFKPVQLACKRMRCNVPLTRELIDDCRLF